MGKMVSMIFCDVYLQESEFSKLYIDKLAT